MPRSPPSNRRGPPPASSTATTAATTAVLNNTTRALSPTPTPRSRPPRSSSLAAPSRNTTTTTLRPPPRAALSRNPSPSPTTPDNHPHQTMPSQPLKQQPDHDLQQAPPKSQDHHHHRLFNPEDDAITALESETKTLKQDNDQLKDEIDRLDAENIRLRDSLRRNTRQKDEEIAELKDQIRGLKEFVSKSGGTGVSGPTTSDEVFGEGMGKLGNGLQNWVLVYWRRSKIDLSQASKATLSELDRLVPTYRDLVSTAKIHFLQSLVSRLLAESIFDTYFVGLSREEADRLAEAERLLGTYATSPEMMNQWRSLTLAILQKDASGKLQRETATIVDALVAKINGLLDEITSSKSNDARDQGLRSLISSAIDLSRLLDVQKAAFTVHMPEVLPHQQILFDAETMEDIGGEDEESLFQREISCVTFPGIIKSGDESGGHLQYRNVISKARVLCCPE
ncbi:hypothetical protein QBC40DRAFT_259677 [Triangularia verruculosa]|uniref:Uncharacterized protein n=1 Tax=Triangularia verruculosa TaxID=2587418 RepID=A0AAN6X8E8_9PEZI|nr:hypothetical protein QBC40DRAFT_259677 [Triangularia verruculosa]